MGAWGTGIFSDDFASDLRADYRELITDGKSHSEAMELLSRKHGESLTDPEEAPVFWIALAATSWDLGRLDEQLKTKALAVIAAGADLDRWEDAKHRRARQAALNKLADKLCRPQKSPTKLKRKPRFVTDWKVNEVVGFRQRSGKWLLLHVVGIHSGEAGDLPIVNMLDWAGHRQPLENGTAGHPLGLFVKVCEVLVRQRRPHGVPAFGQHPHRSAFSRRHPASCNQ